jgi:haloalkane dehalogenase
VVLEYPHREDYIEELKKDYDFVGITSFHNQVPIVLEMCRIARHVAPRTRIVLGGYGAVGIEATMSRNEVAALCDHLCHEEGIRYFRRLLGEDPEAPMTQSHLPKWGYSVPWIDPDPPGQSPVVVASVGCPRGCDFCGTTEMFSHQRVELLSPEQVHAEMRRAWRENPNTLQMTILEEDSYLDIEYMRELGRLLREDEEFGLSHYNFYCLSSNQSLSQWDMDDVMLTGCSTVFIGVESKFAPQEGYHKRRGRDIADTFRDLHQRGIMTTGALMLGFDFQNPHNLEEDMAHFVSLHPTMQQIARVCPFPATPLWHQMREDGRIRPDTRWEEVSFYGGGGMKPKHFTEAQVMGAIEEGYRRLYETWGASVARMIDVNLQGYEHCITVDKNRFYRDRSAFHKKMAMVLYPLLKPMEIYAPNNTVRKRMKDIDRTYGRLLGEPTTFQRSMGQFLTGLAGFQRFLETFYPRENLIKDEPFKRYAYHKTNRPGERPYSLQFPHRRRRYGVQRTAQNGFSLFMQQAGALYDRFDQLRGRQFDETMRRGNPANLLSVSPNPFAGRRGLRTRLLRRTA